MTEAQTEGRTLADRIRSAGLTAWALIGILLLLYGAVAYLLRPLSVLFAPIAIALVVVYLLNPLVGMLQRRGLRRGWAVLVIYVGFLAIVGAIMSFLIPLIARQVSEFIDALPRYVEQIVNEVNEFTARRDLEFRIRVTSQQIFDAIQGNRETIVSFLGGVRSVAGQILHIVITVVIGMILSIYLLLDLPKIQRAFTAAIPAGSRTETLELLDKVGSALGGFFRGQLFVAAFVGVASAVGLSIVKLPFAILIGLLAGIFNLIPMIGPFLAAIPAVLVALLSDHPQRALWAALVLLIVQQIDNHIVSPNVMGRTVRLHPITVMLALLAGGTIAGIFGMLLVIPAVAAIKLVASHVWQKRRELGVPDAIADAGS